MQALVCVQDWRRDEYDIPLDSECYEKLCDEIKDEKEVI